MNYRQRAEKAIGRRLKRSEHVHHHSATQLVICSVQYHRWLHKRMQTLGLDANRNGRPSHYLLRGIPVSSWMRATKRAKTDGHTMKWLILGWLQAYADGK